MREGKDTEEIDQNERLFSLNEIIAETENVDCDETISEGDRSKLLREIDRELLSEYERNQIVRNCARIVEFTSDDDQDCESIFETIVQCMEELMKNPNTSHDDREIQESTPQRLGHKHNDKESANWYSKALQAVRLRALSLVVEKGNSYLSNADFSSAKGYGSPSIPLDIYLMMFQGSLANDIQFGNPDIRNPIQIQQILREVREKSLENGIRIAQQEQEKIVVSPAFYMHGGWIKPVTSLMKTGLSLEKNETLYHIGTGETRSRRDLVFRSADYERKLSLRTEIGIQEECAILSKNFNVTELYIFSIDGASNPVVIGGSKEGLITLPRGRAWGHSATISAVSDLSGIFTTAGVQDTRNDWISTVKFSVGLRENGKWKWQTGRIKDEVMIELTKYYMTKSSLFSLHEHDIGQTKNNPLHGLLIRMIGGSQLFESGNVGVLTKRDISPRSIDCLFLADILAGNNPELATLHPTKFRQRRMGTIGNDIARGLLFEMDDTATSPYSHTLPELLNDSLMYVYSILGGKMLHSLQGCVVESKPIVRYTTKGFTELNTGTEFEQMCERLRLSQQEVLIQDADLSIAGNGPNQLEQACIFLSALKISDEIRRHIDSSSSVHEVAIRVASTLVSHKIGEGIRNGHTKIRDSILAKTTERYDLFKKILGDIKPRDRFGIERHLGNIQSIPFFEEKKRDLTLVEDLLSNGEAARLLFDNGINLGPVFLPIAIEDYTYFKTNNEAGVSSSWEKRGCANLLFIFKSKEELGDVVKDPVRWSRIESLIDIIDYISNMMFERTKKVYSEGKPKFEIDWNDDSSKFKIPEGLDYDSARELYSHHLNSILTQIDEILVESNLSFWDVIDPKRLVSFIFELLLCTKSAVVTDPMGRQGRLHLDQNGMSRETSDVLSEVATERFLPMMETLSLSWLLKSVIAGSMGHSEVLMMDVRPGYGMDGTLLLYSPNSEDLETWIAVESKTYNIQSSAKGQNPAKARDNLLKGLLRHSDKTIIARLSYGKDSVLVLLPPAYSSSARIRDKFVTDTFTSIDKILGKMQCVAADSNNTRIVEYLKCQRNYDDLMQNSNDDVTSRNVEMGVLLSLALDGFRGSSPLKGVDSEVICKSLTRDTIRILKKLGWISERSDGAEGVI